MTPRQYQARWIALLLPVALLVGAWGSQLIGGLYPCEMCHWQRWPHYGAVIAAVLAFVLPTRTTRLALVALAALLIAISGAIGVFHAGVEYHWWEGITACSRTVAASGMSVEDMLNQVLAAPVVRCDAAQWQLFGISLAGYNAILSLGGAAVIARLFGTPPVSWRPGDPRLATDAMIRVDQAGEFGATRIYAGQLAILGDRSPAARKIAGMALQEERHRAFFDRMIAERGVRPTLLQPFWSVAGFALGAVTAAIGREAAMACTAAVETEIDKHYEDQLVRLGDSDPELSDAVREFQAEELEHKETALASGAEDAPAYPLMSVAIRLGCRIAIAAAKRI